MKKFKVFGGLIFDLVEIVREKAFELFVLTEEEKKIFLRFATLSNSIQD
jgi:hypothetical protein